MKLQSRFVAGLVALSASGAAGAATLPESKVIEAESSTHSGTEYSDPTASGEAAVQFGSFGEMLFEAELTGDENALTFVYKSIGEPLEIAISVNGGATQYATLTAAHDWTPYTFDDVVMTSGANTVTVTTSGGRCDSMTVATVKEKEGKCLAKCKGKDSSNGGTLTPSDFLDNDHKSTPLSGGGYDVQRAYTNGNSQLAGAGIGVTVVAGVVSLIPGIGWVAGGAIIILGGGGAGAAAGSAVDEFVYRPAGTISNWTVTLRDNPCPTQCVMTVFFTITQTEAEGATTGGGANTITARGTFEPAYPSVIGGSGKRWSDFPSSTIKGGCPGNDTANVSLSVVARCGFTGEFEIKWAGGDSFMSGQLVCENHCND